MWILTEATELSITSVTVGSLYLTLQNLLSIIVSVLGYAYMARIISPEEMGIVASITMLCSFIQTGVDLGMSSSIAKFVSEDIGKGLDYSKHVVSALILKFILTLAVTLQVIVFSPYLSEILFKTPNYSETLMFASFDAALISLSSLMNSILLGSGRLKRMAIYGISSTVIRWISVTVFLSNGYGLLGVVYGWLTGDSALFMMLASIILKHLKLSKDVLSESTRLLPSMLKFSTPIYLGSMVSFLYTWYDKALILVFLPIQQLGIYNVAYKAFSVFVAIATSIGSSFLPYYGRMYGKNNHRAISEGVRRASKYTMLMMFPLAFGLAILAKPVITLFAGVQYSDAWSILAILSIFGLVYGILPSFSSLLLVYGKTKTILLLDVASVLASLILLPILWRLNLLGLTIMRGSSIIISFIMTFYFTSKIVKIEIDGNFALRILTSSIIMAMAVVVSRQILQNDLLLPLHVMIGALIYLIVARTLKCIGREEAQLIKAIIGEKTAKIFMKILRI